MSKTANQKQAEAANLQLQQSQLQSNQQQMALAQQAAQRQNQIYGQITPFAQSLLGVGQNSIQAYQDAAAGKVDPTLYNAMLMPQKNALASGFQGARQNLTEALGKYGQLGSGIGVGPMANQYNAEATAQGNAANTAYLGAYQQGLANATNGLGLGFQGAGMLTGQQQVFNPISLYGGATGATQAGVQDPTQYQSNLSRIGGSVLAAGVGAATGMATGGLGNAAGGFQSYMAPAFGQLPMTRPGGF